MQDPAVVRGAASGSFVLFRNIATPSLSSLQTQPVCPDKQPEWSAIRTPSYGFVSITIESETTVQWCVMLWMVLMHGRHVDSMHDASRTLPWRREYIEAVLGAHTRTDRVTFTRPAEGCGNGNRAGNEVFEL